MTQEEADRDRIRRALRPTRDGYATWIARGEHAGECCEHCGAPPAKQVYDWQEGDRPAFGQCPVCGADHYAPPVQYDGPEEQDISY